VPRPQQHAVAAALRAGDAVEDPALAPLAVEAAGWRLHQTTRTQRVFTLGYAALAVVWLVNALTGGDRTDYVFAALFALLAAVNVVVSHRTRDRLERGLAANRELAARAR
jgi:hypothetical protein